MKLIIDRSVNDTRRHDVLEFVNKVTSKDDSKNGSQITHSHAYRTMLEKTQLHAVQMRQIVYLQKIL